MKRLTFYRQDRSEHSAYYFVDGFGKREGRRLRERGWSWIDGPDGGCWHTPDPAEWERARRAIGLTPFYGGTFRWRLDGALERVAESAE